MAEPKVVIRNWVIYPSAILAALLMGYVAAFFLLANDQTVTPVPELPDEWQIVNLDEKKALQILTATESGPGTSVAESRRRDLLFGDRYVDIIPSVVSTRVVAVTIMERKRISLAGSILGNAPWTIDGNLLVESFVEDRPYAKVLIGGYIELTDGKRQSVSRLGETYAKSEFGPRDIAITDLIPHNKIVTLRFSVLRADESGRVSNLYLIVE